MISLAEYLGGSQWFSKSSGSFIPHWKNGRVVSCDITGANVMLKLPAVDFARQGGRYYTLYNESTSTNSVEIRDITEADLLATLAVGEWAKVYLDADSNWLVVVF